MKKQPSKRNTKILVILGPTASGKSDLALLLARKYDGEVVSADSRQIYKHLDIGTGKITKREMNGIAHHLLDVASAKNEFSVMKYKVLAEKAIDNILARGKIPILVGGTGQYINAVIDNVSFPEVPPNKEMRAKLENKTTTELFTILRKIDTRRAKDIDRHNPRRLIRAIEIARTLGFVPKISTHKESGNFKVLQIGIKTDEKKLEKNIHERILTRLKKGMLEEISRLHKNGLSWKKMETLGLEYRFLARHLRGQITKEKMIEQLYIATRQYAKRQKTWWKKDNRIKWFTLEEREKIEKEIEKFLKLHDFRSKNPSH